MGNVVEYQNKEGKQKQRKEFQVFYHDYMSDMPEINHKCRHFTKLTERKQNSGGDDSILLRNRGDASNDNF
jgi:hypothetical protein